MRQLVSARHLSVLLLTVVGLMLILAPVAGAAQRGNPTSPSKAQSAGNEGKPAAENAASARKPVSSGQPAKSAAVTSSSLDPSQAQPAAAKSGGKPATPKGHVKAPAWTEDNDTNDKGTPNNVADRGDNAHPSGKDRSVEHGNSGNQGRAASDPDNDGRGPDRSNGGRDKPNRRGGIDKADQDGNNGCGNDDDFEDDNEGWCGRKPRGNPGNPGGGNPGNPGGGNPGNGNCGNDKPVGNAKNCPGGPDDDQDPDRPGRPGRDGSDDDDSMTPKPDHDDEVLGDGDVDETDVAGEVFERKPPAPVVTTSVLGFGGEAAQLASTGIGAPVMLTLGLGFLLTGAGALRMRPRRV